MKKYGLLVVTLAICAFASLPQMNVYSQKLAAADSAFERNQIIVKLKSFARPAVETQRQDGRGRAQLAGELLAEHGRRAEAIETFDRQVETSAYVVEFGDDLTVEEAILRARQDPRVEYAEPNYKIEVAETMPNDSRFNEMWPLRNFDKFGADIQATFAWDLTTGNSNVVVAITDQGIDIGHPDLAANIWINAAEVPNNGVDDDNNGLIDDVNGWNFSDDNKDVTPANLSQYHGSFVAGIVGAVGNNGTGVTGVAWQVKLMPLKFIGGATSNIAGAVRAINYAVAHKRRGVNLRVINASWGPGRVDCTTSFSQSLKDAITAAGNRGILFVSSAGNGICGNNSAGDDLDQLPEYPAAWSGEIPTMMSVAAVDRQDNLASFSNFGPNSVAVAAPGVEILSTVPRGYVGLPAEASYVGGSSFSGTSFAAPHVTGIAALIAAYDPALTPAQIKTRIIETAEPIPALTGKVRAAGRANAYNALRNIPGSLPPLGFTEVVFTKKIIYLKGAGLLGGAMGVEINGQPASGKVRYDDAFKLANGSYTELNVKMGKAAIQESFPLNTAVSVTLINQATNERVSLVVIRPGASQSAADGGPQPAFVFERPNSLTRGRQPLGASQGQIR